MKEENKEMNITVTSNDVKISEAFGLTQAEVAVIKKNVAKGVTNIELSYFIKTCLSMNLNPFNKEVWCYKDNRDNLLIFAGRDGFLSKAQQSPSFNGVRSCEYCENDEIEINVPMGQIHHKINPKEPRGEILGAYAIVFRKDGEPTIEIADFHVFNKGRNTWKSHPADMIKKVAESHALKKAFGISGIQSEYNFNIVNGVAKPLDTTKISNSQISYIESLLHTSSLDDEKRNKIENEMFDYSFNNASECIANLKMNQLSNPVDDINRPNHLESTPSTEAFKEMIARDDHNYDSKK